MEIKEMRKKFLRQPSKTALYTLSDEELIKIREEVRKIKLTLEHMECTVAREDFMFDINRYLSVVRSILDHRKYDKYLEEI